MERPATSSIVACWGGYYCIDRERTVIHSGGHTLQNAPAQTPPLPEDDAPTAAKCKDRSGKWSSKPRAPQRVPSTHAGGLARTVGAAGSASGARVALLAQRRRGVTVTRCSGGCAPALVGTLLPRIQTRISNRTSQVVA